MREDIMLRYASRALAMVAIIATLGGLAASSADARIGSGLSLGSRGSRTFSAPPSTATAPSAGSMQRTVTQPNFNTAPRPGYSPGGFFGRPGLLGGLAAGFLGAGLFGLLFGHGFLGGIGGLFSFLGLIVQFALVALLVRFLWSYFARRNMPAYASGPLYRNAGPPQSPIAIGGGGGAVPSDTIGIGGADYDAFEHLLGEVQAAYSAEDIAALRARATPEMVSYFSEDLTQNASRGVVNKVSNVKLLQGDLAEAWREGDADYATVAMRFSLRDCMVDRASGAVVDGDPTQPQEASELWTFRRTRGAPWMLSAIQQTR
jgi:predicted lipid-binding transport protein (Tim44 family)